jgi:ATP-binding cassette subfamily F protein 3
MPCAQTKDHHQLPPQYRTAAFRETTCHTCPAIAIIPVAPHSVKSISDRSHKASSSPLSQPQKMESEIKTQIPNIDPVLSEYSVGYLTHAASSFTSDADSKQAVAAVSALLLSASGDLSPQNETSIHNLVEKFVLRLNAANGADGERRRVAPSAKRLDQAIHVGSSRNISTTLGLTGGAVDLESANTRKVESRVDKKKLEKAERKLRAKQDRKEFKNVEYEASKLLNVPDELQSYEEFYMSVNPLQLGSDAQSKSKDIKIDRFDISIPGLRILTDSSLTLAYGRRYGLVGQNGIGKSTLLRALSRREVSIPTHISILHVEQEVSRTVCPCIGTMLMIHRLPEMTPRRCKLSWTPMCGESIFSRSKM